MRMSKKKMRKAIVLPRTAYIAICVTPFVLVALFYLLRSNLDVMYWATTHISAPVRGVLGLISSIFPFSLMEVLCAAAGVWLIYYIV